MVYQSKKLPSEERLPVVAAILPCYKSKKFILDVISEFGPEVQKIFCVDDKCPEQTGIFVEENCKDLRVKVIYNAVNQGVGGATIAGMEAAVEAGADILIKVDSDGQMDPRLIPTLISPIIIGDADFCKGNRFFDLQNVRSMPKIRLFGNAILSFMTKLSSGYWNIFDPTNGFLAIHRSIFVRLNTEKLSKRYFFESDLLFRIGLLRARVIDMPMVAVYGDEESSLKISQVIGEFFFKHVKNTFRRIIYNYFVRDFSAGTLFLILSFFLFLFGAITGIRYISHSWLTGEAATAGQVMISTLPLFISFQLGISFLTYDIENTPKFAKWPALSRQDDFKKASSEMEIV